MLTYRKTKDGQWVAFGPVAEVTVGAVRVTTKDGRIKDEQVVSLGKTFDVSGTPHVYGYLVAKAAPVAASRSRLSGWRPCGYPGCRPEYCDECDGEGYRGGRY
jgi:hypothetical protein